MPDKDRISPHVVWDVDDVLNDLTLEWAAAEGVRLSDGTPPTGDPGSWICQQGIELSAYLKSLDAFRARRYATLEPNPAVLSLLTEWSGPRATHIAMTATPIVAQSIVASWVMSHFGSWFRAVWFCPSRRPSDPSGIAYTSKGQVIAGFVGRSLLIDDSKVNLGSLMHGDRGLLFPRPWNSSRGLPPLTGLKIHSELDNLQAQ
jgi:hypothetical protein